MFGPASATLNSVSRYLRLGGLVTYTTKQTRAVSGMATSSASDGALYKRPVRQEPANVKTEIVSFYIDVIYILHLFQVKYGFVPIEWFNFFIPKTGVTGFYTLIFTAGTYVTSKEILVMEHNFYNGLGMLVLCVLLTNKIGKQVAREIDKHIDQYEASYSQVRTNQKKMSEDGIKEEKKLQWSSEGQLLLLDAKRENVRLQLEYEYRKRLAHVFNEIKKRLDCQVELTQVEGRLVQKNIVAYVVNEVQKSLTPDFLNKYMDKCIEDLEVLSKNFK